jgi:hypothetical protein
VLPYGVPVVAARLSKESAADSKGLPGAVPRAVPLEGYAPAVAATTLRCAMAAKCPVAGTATIFARILIAGIKYERVPPAKRLNPKTFPEPANRQFSVTPIQVVAASHEEGFSEPGAQAAFREENFSGVDKPFGKISASAPRAGHTETNVLAS